MKSGKRKAESGTGARHARCSAFRFPLSAFFLFLLAASAAASTDEQFLSGLRARRLFRLAEVYCTEQLRRDDLTETRRVELVLELSRTLGEHALHAPPNERRPLWDQAQQVLTDYREAFPQSPRLLLVQLQSGLTWLAQGELARQEAQLQAGQEPLVEQARDALRRAARELEQVAAAAEQKLRDRLRRPASSAAELSAEELAALEKNVAFQLARVYRNQAESYPLGSADRANSLTQALEKLGRLSQLAVADDMVWRARIDQVVCQRLLGDEAQATQSLAALVAAKPPAEIALRAQAEKIRLLLATKQLDAALAAAALGRAVAGQTSPDLDLAHLETSIAAWQAAHQAGDAATVERYQRQAAAQVQQIEREHGAYWMRRAEMLLGRSVGAAAGGDAETLARAAASLYRSGQIAEALAAYDRAAAEARRQGAADRAFELAFTAAAIEHQRADPTAAFQRFQQLARALPAHPRAGEAHRLAILQLAERTRALPAPERPAALHAYRRALEEHLATWPRDPTSVEVRLWLGDLQRAERHWAEAIAAYRGVPADHARAETALRALAGCYESWLAELAAKNQPTAQLAGEAAEQLTAASNSAADSPLHRFGALTAAKLLITYAPQSAPQAERVLRTALDQAGAEAPAAWRSEAATLLAFSLALQNRHADAARVLESLSSGSVEGLVAMLAALQKLQPQAPPALRAQLAQLQMRTVELLQPRRQELRGDALRTYEVGRASALAAMGKSAEALDAYNQLMQQYPRDGAIQQARAELLQSSTDATAVRAALDQWRAIEAKSRRGGERWFAARYAQAEAHYRLGDKAQAAKLIKLTRILHPELGGPEQRAKFERLLEHCE